MLPAVPTSKRKDPAFNTPGLKMNSVEPTWRPLEDASQISVTAFTLVRCWAFNPGSALPALMLKIRTSRLRIAARAREVRRTCPPPSPMLPSISIIFQPSITHCLKRVCTRQTPIMENLRLSIEKSEGMSFGCLVDQRDRLVASSFGSNSPLVEKHLVEYSTKTNLRSHRLGAKSCWRSRRFESMVNLRSMPPRSPCQSNHRQLFTMRDPWRKRERDEA